jgi:3-dehydroquinate dehydratase II
MGETPGQGSGKPSCGDEIVMNILSGYQILVVNGPNLRFIGQRDEHVYGSQKISMIPDILKEKNPDLSAGINLEFFQANGEGEIIDRLEKARQDNISGIVINPGAYTHTSLALADCLGWIDIPFVEVHLSNIWGRDEIRHRSLTAGHSIGVVAGFGIMSYIYGLQALMDFLNKNNQIPEDK